MKTSPGFAILFAAVALTTLADGAHSDEYFVGAPIAKNGLRISAAYVLGVAMTPEMPPTPGAGDVLHLEADIEATADNRHGFHDGDWVPYLSIVYSVQKKGSDRRAIGSLLPMTALDGPHYAAGVRFEGPGEYRVIYRIAPPIMLGLARHTDEESGVEPWWTPFEVSWTFTYPSKPIEE